MGFDDGAVDQIQTVARFRSKGIKNPFPDAASRPTVEAIVGCRVRPIAFRQIAPRHPGAQNVKYRVQDSSIVRASTLSALWHQRLKNSPFVIAQIKSHDPPPSTVNHVRSNYSIHYLGTDPNIDRIPS